MPCHEEFPLTKITYNLGCVAAFLTTGAVVVFTRLGALALTVFEAALVLGLTLTLRTTCARCLYYGRRCGLGAGKLAPALGPRRDPDEFGKTLPQWFALLLLAVAPLLGLVGAGRSLAAGEWFWPALFFGCAVALILPHPWWTCRYCAQQRHCPVGQKLACSAQRIQ